MTSKNEFYKNQKVDYKNKISQKKDLIDELKSHLKSDDWDKKIDHLFIDSLHTYDHVMKQLKKYEPYVTPGGIITLHDILHDPPVLSAIQNYFKNR